MRKHINKENFVTAAGWVVGAFLGRFNPPTKIHDAIPDNVWTFLMIIIYALVLGFFVRLLMRIIFNDNVVSGYYLWHDGKVRGLWKGDRLVHQIEKYSNKSAIIRMKVTRGKDLLEKDKIYGFWKIFQNINGNSELDRPVLVQALLIIPCFKESHVQERYETHKKQENIPEEKFLETWYQFLQLTSEYKHSLKIETRFYFGNHSKWRFYIFSPPEDVSDKSVVLFSDYDKTKDGRKTPMYKVIKDEKNIGGFMSRYFEEIWDESLSPSEWAKAVESGNIWGKGSRVKGHFCLRCKYNQTCKNFVSNYSCYLKQ